MQRLLGDPLFAAINELLFALDNIFFPGFRRVIVTRPIFIIGHPRSGTTFLHRSLTEGGEFTVFTLQEIVIPSLVGRKILGPLIGTILRKGRGGTFPKKVGHEGSVGSVEEEEGLFMHKGNSQFVALLTPLAFSDWDFAEIVYGDEQPDEIRRQTMDFFKKCLQRQVYYLGRPQVVAKMNYSAMRIQSLLETFPDAKIVYIVRSPYETISSHLSLHRNIFDYRWGLANIPPERLKRYYERRYGYDVAFYRYMEDFIESGPLDLSRFMALSYEDLQNDFQGSMQRVIDFTGITISDKLRRKIEEQTELQRSYHREHENLELETFGLTKDRIAEDLSFVFERYGFKK